MRLGQRAKGVVAVHNGVHGSVKGDEKKVTEVCQICSR